MSEHPQLNNPWLVACWPGMGHVALSAGYYLMSKLGMYSVGEVTAPELFDVEYVEVRNGLIRPAQAPRNRLYAWNDPDGKRDILLFIGETQPPIGKRKFCMRLLEQARSLGVEHVLTFAAMTTQSTPSSPSRTFGAAIDVESLAQLRDRGLQILEEGHIGGLNGVLLGVAAQMGLPGACLLGELPHVFTQVLYPKAALTVLKTFCSMAEVSIDFTEIEDQARTMEGAFEEIFARIQRSRPDQPEEETFAIESPPEQRLSPEDERRIEELFTQAAEDRAKAYVLKRELDRLEVFAEYEDRFLDLFKKPE